MDKIQHAVSSETEIFYNMIALFECAQSAAEYLLNSPYKAGIISIEFKISLNRVLNDYERFKREVLTGLPAKHRDAYDREWKRDYGVYAAVFSSMSNMTDEQRGVLEEFCLQLQAGNVKVEQG